MKLKQVCFAYQQLFFAVTFPGPQWRYQGEWWLTPQHWWGGQEEVVVVESVVKVT